MSLYQSLQQVRTEEDVKDAYIKALKLKTYTKNLIDVQTNEIWFEAKEKATTPVAMFSQLLSYVRVAHKSGEPIPPFLAVFDREKAALMETTHALPLFKDKTIEWSTAASQVSKETIKKVQPYIEAHFVVYKIETHETEFIQAVSTAIKEGKFVRTPITPDNLKQVFDKWVDMIGKEIVGVSDVDYALIFFADIMHDGKNATIKNLPAKLVHDGDTPLFMLRNEVFELSSLNGYRRFWAIYHRPPNQEYREYLLERRDSLLPVDERSFKGAYYTPLKVVDKAYDLLSKTLGKNWQEKYIVWDMCCGVGNLEVKHSNHRNVFMSTLDQADIEVMRASYTCASATHFQYDYLNDDIDDDGNIEYKISNKLPKELRQCIVDFNEKKPGAKKILILINPPYAESGEGFGAGNKSGVAKTKFASKSMVGYGKSSNELFTQFVVRLQKEIPDATLAMFSKLKYINAPNFELFRELWRAKFMGGYIVHSKAFDGLKGEFPIGFLIWDTSIKEKISDIEVDVYDKNATWCGKKSFYNLPKSQFLSNWIDRPKANKVNAIALKNAISPSTAKKTLSLWSDNAIGHMLCDSNDMQNAIQTAIFSSTHGIGHKGGFYINESNLLDASVVFAVRRLIKPSWINDRDHFLQSKSVISDEFKLECLIWMLFHGSNLTASADNLVWMNNKWSVVNHFIPFTEQEVNANGRFESTFMSVYLNGKILLPEANAVLSEGRSIWKHYFTCDFNRKIKEELLLNRPDVGWYQIRKAIELIEKEDGQGYDFSAFKSSYGNLSQKLRRNVLDMGFLKS